tara:strand:+ start:2313 stop:2639 length:327 start_codon:yes stop_codon:yes gene_type:complete
MPKYKNEKIARLDSEEYREIFDNKGVKFLNIRRTMNFADIKDEQYQIQSEHIWSTGNTLFRLSYLYYNTYNFWWVIALVNNKPTDAHYSLGDVVLIPADPYAIANSME